MENILCCLIHFVQNKPIDHQDFKKNLFFRLWLDNPILSLKDLQVIKRTKYRGWTSKIIDITYPISESGNLKQAIDRICIEAEEASKDHKFIILSDRRVGVSRVPVGALLAAGAVHHHLISKR